LNQHTWKGQYRWKAKDCLDTQNTRANKNRCEPVSHNQLR
jgi:hypothetical protein